MIWNANALGNKKHNYLISSKSGIANRVIFGLDNSDYEISRMIWRFRVVYTRATYVIAIIDNSLEIDVHTYRYRSNLKIKFEQVEIKIVGFILSIFTFVQITIVGSVHAGCSFPSPSPLSFSFPSLYVHLYICISSYFVYVKIRYRYAQRYVDQWLRSSSSYTIANSKSIIRW